MRISLLAVGTRMPGWVKEGFDAYQRRLPAHFQLQLEEIPAGQRKARGDTQAAMDLEAEHLLRRASAADRIIALDERGRERSTLELAENLRQWQHSSPHVALLVGGPDGLSPACRDKADELWSLSRLTLPHALVRIVVAEQVYRAWTILQKHPYHRA